MTKIAFVFTLLVAVLVCSLPAAPAQALVARTFISAAGSDANNCANVATPCRHLAAAYAATAPNGEIYVLDPANYGSVTITSSVSIEGHGWASIAPVSGSAAITINAGLTDKINIIGVVLDGAAITNTSGIVFNSGGTLNIQDSVIRNFSSRGIYFAPSGSSQIFVSNTLVADNGDQGIYIFAGGSQTLSGELDHVRLLANATDGLRVTTANKSHITVSNSESSNNGFGISAFTTNSPLTVFVRNTSISNNTSTGLFASGIVAEIRVTRSTITGNALDWSTGIGGEVTSYNDNNFDANLSTNGASLGAATYR
jgi:hypothetical protein